MEKLLTKNLGISILAGISIVGGSFWMRISDSHTQISTDTTAVDTTSSPTLDQQEISRVSSSEESADEPTIKVADLPDINGLVTSDLPADQEISNASDLSPEEQAIINFIHTPSGSTLAYEDISDKKVLYADGIQKYSSKDIKSTVATNRATLLTYGLALTKIFSGYPFYTKLSPTEITFNIYSNKDPKDTGLSELESMRLTYEATAKRLVTITVPESLISLHLKLTNTTDRISQLIKNMEEVKADRLLALNSARQYVEEGKFTIGTLGEISEYLGDKNIVFGQENKLKLSIGVIN